MKISVNDQELYSLSDMQCKVICDYVHGDIMEDDMKRRLEWVLMHLHEQCMKILRDEWMPKLAKRMDSIPTSDEKFAELVFSQPDYMDRAARDKASTNVSII
jgi:hypothetical protein